MSLPKKIRRTVRNMVAPRTLAYDERRARRALILTVVGGLVVALAFGLVLYNLNVTGRIGGK